MTEYTLDIKDDVIYNTTAGIYTECEKNELTNDECIIFTYFPQYKDKVITKQYDVLDTQIIDRYNKVETDRKSCFVFLLYDITNKLDYCLKILPNVLQCVEEHEKNIHKITIKMFYRIYIDISTFLIDETNEKHKIIMTMFDKLLRSNLVELHQITYPTEIKKSHGRRIIRFLPLLDDNIEYFYSKDIDGIFSQNDINLINTIQNGITDIDYYNGMWSPSIINSRYRLAYYPIYTKFGSGWIYDMYTHILQTKDYNTYKMYLEDPLFCIPAGLYITNLKLSTETFNEYYKIAKKIVSDLKLNKQYLDEIFLNYLIFTEKQNKLEDGKDNLVVIPDITTNIEDISRTSNSFNFDIKIHDNKLIYSTTKLDVNETDDFFRQKYLKYKQKYLELRRNI
jgi:hypothetical protein